MNEIINGIQSDGQHADKPFLAVLIGDSLSLPRYKASIPIEDTYFCRMGIWWRERYGNVVFWPLSKAGTMLEALVGAFSTFLGYAGPNSIDVAIVHLGIVDCAPRPLPFRLRSILGMMPPFLRNCVTGFLHKNRRRLFKLGISFRFTGPSKFQSIYSDLLKTLSSECSRVYVINISPATEATYQHSPGLRESITIYNDIINKVASNVNGVKVIDIFSESLHEVRDDSAEDIHMTKKGHDFILQKLCEYEDYI